MGTIKRTENYVEMVFTLSEIIPPEQPPEEQLTQAVLNFTNALGKWAWTKLVSNPKARHLVKTYAQSTVAIAADGTITVKFHDQELTP